MSPHVPAAIPAQIRALRSTVGLTRRGRDALLRVEGAASYDVLDRLLPSEVHVRNRGGRPGLLLDEQGFVEADLMMLADGDDYLLFAEGLDSRALAERIEAAAEPGEELRVIPLDDATVIDLNGPYAWQVLGDLAGEGAQNLRFSSWFKIDEDILCHRAGTTGEYGYSFLLPRSREAELAGRLLELGQAADIVEVGAEALSHCQLEAWFFDIRRAPRACPLEWGLQWRLQWDKEFRGAEALRGRRGLARASAAFRADGPVRPGAPITLDGEPIGQVAAASDLGGETIGAALLQPLYAASGVSAYLAGETPIRTVSAPFVRYQSMNVGPRSGRYVRATAAG